jgi:hypothetical protein
VLHRSPAERQLVARIEHPKGEIRILAVGAREALVEAADLREDITAVRHVRRGPARGLEARGVALPVGRLPSAGQRDQDPALAGRHARGEGTHVVGQALPPARRRQHVVIKKGDPLRTRPAPALVAGSRRASTRPAHDLEPRGDLRRQLAKWQRLAGGGVRAVVDHDDPLRQ